MKYLNSFNIFENYFDSKLNSILDKINIDGIDSLSHHENNFLRSYGNIDISSEIKSILDSGTMIMVYRKDLTKFFKLISSKLYDINDFPLLSYFISIDGTVFNHHSNMFAGKEFDVIEFSDIYN